MSLLGRFFKSPETRKSSAEKKDTTEARGLKIESALDPMIRGKTLSVLSKPNKIKAAIPDFSSPVKLKNLGLIQKDGKWYVPNIYFPEPITEDSVIIDYTKEGEAPDIGFCSRAKFRSIYADSDAYKKDSINYIDPAMLSSVEWTPAVQCKTEEFTIVPVGTRVNTPEGPDIEVTPGTVVSIEVDADRGNKKSLVVKPIAKLLDRFTPDPFNPTATEKAFAMLDGYVKYSEKNGKELKKEDQEQLHRQLRESFLAIERGGIGHEAYNGETGESEQTLRQHFEKAAKITQQLDAEISSRINAPSFDERIEQARKILKEINENANLSPEQKNIRQMYVMARLLPKSNLHQHLKGSAPEAVTLMLAERNGLPVEPIKDAYARGAKGFDTLTQFNKDYGIIAGAIRKPQDYRDAVKGIVREAMTSGQLTVEIRCAVLGQRDEDGNEATAQAATQNIIDGIKEARKELGPEAPKVGFTLLGYRGRDPSWDKPEEVMEHARVAIEFAKANPDMRFSFDIAGPEDTGYPPKRFKEAFDMIKEFNRDVRAGKIKAERIGMTIHAGETPTYDKQNENDEGKPGYEGLREAIEMISDPNDVPSEARIGHGVQLVNDYATLSLAIQRGITVEICGVCNVQSIPLNTQGMAIHPVERFLKEGLKISICTDNDCICGTSVTQEYGRFLLTGHSELMNWNAVKQVARTGVESSFVSDAEKAESLKTFDERVRRIEKLLHDEVKSTDIESITSKI